MALLYGQMLIWFSVMGFLSLNLTSVSSHPGKYKHVILMHGLLGNSSEFNFVLKLINQVHPGTTYTLIDAFNNIESLVNLWNQTHHVGLMMADVMKQHPDGVNLLCFSQGGMVCRGVIETMHNHNVHNFISLSSPQGGQYGDTSFIKPYVPGAKKDIYKVFYTPLGQQISIANYWNDPHHQTLYRKFNEFLPVLNNQSSSRHNQSHAFKSNFLKVKNLIMIGGPQDDVITPWQSSQFAALDENEKVVEMEHQEWYMKDWFGLRTLDKRRALHKYTVPGHLHKDWVNSPQVFHKCIEPWLD